MTLRDEVFFVVGVVVVAIMLTCGPAEKPWVCATDNPVEISKIIRSSLDWQDALYAHADRGYCR